ncbi:MAG: ABC-F family ATP-binding cassette domain-containing protein [Bacteroidetes bacterium]|nr:ABC-F family ATP-binding cassette domain-containing protein [Bacteroidota bacterium]
MNLISIESLSKAYADRPLFHNLNFGLALGEKIAVVGRNGAGKSTLMKIMAGLVPPDEGQVTHRKGITVGYLPQVPELDDQLDIMDNLFDRQNPVAALVLDYEHLLTQEDSGSNLAPLMAKMDEMGAWDFEAKAKEIMGKLGIGNTAQLVGSLSGGQKKRVALAKLLLQKPDVILLDEPTNHLDIEAIEWLERFLLDQFQTIVLITHDRYFLEAVTSEIMELSELKIYKHEGKYADYLQNRLTRMQIAQVEKDKAQQLMKKELDWLRRQPQARGTKAKYRVDAFDGIREKATQKLEHAHMELSLRASRQGSKIVELHDVGHGFGGNLLFEHLSHKFAKGERIGLVGANGSGKSTLLQIITGSLRPQKGQVVIGETTKFGFFTQDTTSLKPDNRVIEEVREITEYVMLGDGTRMSVPRFLELFLFDRKQQYAYVETLSGGERKRLQLCKVLLADPNFLVLDEPTNDFDTDSLNVLEEYLLSFSGGLLIVTHDRYFLDRIVDHLFVFEGKGQVRDFPGNYTDYRMERALSIKKNDTAKVQAVGESGRAKQREGNKLTYKEQREYESIEVDIAALEGEKTTILAQMNSGMGAHQELAAWAQRIMELEAAIDTKTERWMELEEKQGR